MAATAALTNSLIPVSEYLGSVYRPDVDYVDGVLEERNVGEFDHSDIQRAILVAFIAQEGAAGLRAMQGLRVQVSETRFRVPDVCLIPRGSRPAVVRQAPLVCVEVLSPLDTLARTRKRAEDFLKMGVPAVWIFNPATRTAFVLDGSGMTEQRTGTLCVGGTPVCIDIQAIFSALDIL